MQEEHVLERREQVTLSDPSACLCRYSRQVLARERGFSREWGIGDCRTRNRDSSCLPQGEKILIQKSRPVPMREWLITHTGPQHLSTAR